MLHARIFARDIMDTDPPYCLMDASVEDIAKRLADENLTGMLVVDDDKHLFGLITESDLIDQQKNLHVPTAVALFDMVIPVGESRFEQEIERMQAMTAEDLARTSVVTVRTDADLGEIAAVMADEHVHHLPVMDGESVVGMISKHDVIKALVANR